jgi:hypothetical protein
MDLEETEAKNDYADESQQQFNRPLGQFRILLESTLYSKVNV